jgi:hypothetical protein
MHEAIDKTCTYSSLLESSKEIKLSTSQADHTYNFLATPGILEMSPSITLLTKSNLFWSKHEET